MFDHITADNFQDHIRQGEIIPQKLFDRLSEIFDRDFDPYDKFHLSIDFDYKEGELEECGTAVSVENIGEGLYEVIYIF